jgi:two-component system, OmpR family, response regulator MprA
MLQVDERSPEMNESVRDILIVEDDRHLAERLTDGLEEAGYRVRRASSSRQAMSRLVEQRPDLVLLDLGLPDADGLDLLRAFREKEPHVPVIVTTARDQVVDRVAGLEGGADDYLVKPYAFEELLARIRTQLRHAERAQVEQRLGDLVVDLKARTARRGERTLDLTAREFDLLACLVALRGEVASRDMLQRTVWKVTSRMTSMDNVIDVHISRLRQKLDVRGEVPLLQTLRGVGFVLKAAK